MLRGRRSRNPGTLWVLFSLQAKKANLFTMEAPQPQPHPQAFRPGSLRNKECSVCPSEEPLGWSESLTCALCPRNNTLVSLAHLSPKMLPTLNLFTPQLLGNHPCSRPAPQTSKHRTPLWPASSSADFQESLGQTLALLLNVTL